jgi:signal transduction histidine kinase
VKCRLSLPPTPSLCHADPDAVNRTILELAAEAATEMPKGGVLVLGARQCTIDRVTAGEFPGSAPGDYMRVTVKDSGSGLGPERLERVFYPEETDRPAVASAWELTRRLGGFASIESAESVGTAVHLYFPCAVRIAEPAAEYMEAHAAE